MRSVVQHFDPVKFVAPDCDAGAASKTLYHHKSNQLRNLLLQTLHTLFLLCTHGEMAGSARASAADTSGQCADIDARLAALRAFGQAVFHVPSAVVTTRAWRPHRRLNGWSTMVRALVAGRFGRLVARRRRPERRLDASSTILT
eukprot:703111-Amphidinium_carterae.2